jgi:hypothetical protein
MDDVKIADSYAKRCKIERLFQNLEIQYLTSKKQKVGNIAEQKDYSIDLPFAMH